MLSTHTLVVRQPGLGSPPPALWVALAGPTADVQWQTVAEAKAKDRWE